jgi:hypothetical protein
VRCAHQYLLGEGNRLKNWQDHETHSEWYGGKGDESHLERSNFMIDVKEAVKIAINYAKDIFSEEKFDKITLEEVELEENELFWHVTLGMGKIVLDSPFGALDVLAGKPAKLAVKYKIFKIHRETGQVHSVKMRKE